MDLGAIRWQCVDTGWLQQQDVITVISQLARKGPLLLMRSERKGKTKTKMWNDAIKLRVETSKQASVQTNPVWSR